MLHPKGHQEQGFVPAGAKRRRFTHTELAPAVPVASMWPAVTVVIHKIVISLAHRTVRNIVVFGGHVAAIPPYPQVFPYAVANALFHCFYYMVPASRTLFDANFRLQTNILVRRLFTRLNSHNVIPRECYFNCLPVAWFSKDSTVVMCAIVCLWMYMDAWYCAQLCVARDACRWCVC